MVEPSPPVGSAGRDGSVTRRDFSHVEIVILHLTKYISELSRTILRLPPGTKRIDS